MFSFSLCLIFSLFFFYVFFFVEKIKLLKLLLFIAIKQCQQTQIKLTLVSLNHLSDVLEAQFVGCKVSYLKAFSLDIFTLINFSLSLSHTHKQKHTLNVDAQKYTDEKESLIICLFSSTKYLPILNTP